jgi:ATP-dependent DNA helicase RecG
VVKPEQSVGLLKGVGAALAAKLSRLGIATAEDLLRHYPRRYDDFSQINAIRDLRPGLVTFRAQIQQAASRRSFRRRLTIQEAIMADDTGTVKAVWFNQPYLVNQLKPGTAVMVSGKLEFKNNDLALQSPAIEPDIGATKNTGRIVPVYPETEGLTSKQLRSLIAQVLPLAGDLPETLPPDIIRQAALLPLSQALKAIHFPENQFELTRARRRLAFEELWYLILASLVIKHEIKTEKAPVIKFEADIAKQFVASLGFGLTAGQRQSAWQILQDLATDRPMNRLLEGDVGSGKTVVAVMAAMMAQANGYQTAIMVPTEILARQHAENIGRLVEAHGGRVAIILGGQPAAVRRANLEAAQNGAADVIIGTHALLGEEVEFKNLGLVVIDEQHRFGVQQRQTLKAKAGRLPHLLSMTATPIPRSLALTVYGDLDISIIEGLPPGRQPVVTKVVKPGEREAVYQEIDNQIGGGRQVFVVCPLIEDSDKLGAKSVTAEAARLEKTVFKHRQIGVLHGRLSPAEKQAVMDKFLQRDLDLLVTTSVIEVGIDIPNAVIMIVEGAERFGLAALHQLRGRVGRGAHQSFCYLLSENPTPSAEERLAALERTTDGFRLAQIDLDLRGPGQIYGLRQHGDLELDLADISDTKLLAEVRELAARFLQTPANLLKYPRMNERVNRLKAVTSLD